MHDNENYGLKIIKKEISDSIKAKQAVLEDENLLEQLNLLAKRCLESLLLGGKVIFSGNGGSFADSQHLSAEFTSRFLFDRAPLASIALGTNSSAMSAIGNDYGYDQVFARELEAIAKKEDIYIPISTSGNSPNIITSVDTANKLGIHTVAWTGASGGKLKDYCSCICVPSSSTARIQESHITMGHILCGIVEANYFSG
jgi:D-sedoheptulose 7-phosphate isomerase